MNEQIKCIVELQRIDSNILDRKHMMDVIPSKITKAEQPLKESRLALDKTKQRLGSLEKKKRDKEDELDGINEKIKKLKARIAEIKTNKEYQAHLKEIESVEKERYTVEDEILFVMEEIDASSKEIETEAKEEICQGCNMNIPPQLFVEIKKNEEIINCPQCRRILYYKNNT